MSTLLKAGDKVWVTTRDGDKAATVHSGCWHEGEFWYCLTDMEGMPARPGRKGWRAPEWRVRLQCPYNGPRIRIDNLRLSFTSMTPPKEQPTMIDDPLKEIFNETE